MAKLNKKMAKAIDATEASTGGSFELLPNGKYLTQLLEVEVQTHPNFPDHVVVWNASFTNLRTFKDGKKYPGRQWLRLNVIVDETMPANYQKEEKKWQQFVSISNGSLKAFFENMGYSTDSDTDEMIDEPALLNIATRTMQSGARAGEKANEVKGVIALPEDFDYDEWKEENGVEDDEESGSSADSF